tara:strand:- start:479 stop:625 length:147 start_codon:yes stop_codon:yes gene_type:complete
MKQVKQEVKNAQIIDTITHMGIPKIIFTVVGSQYQGIPKIMKVIYKIV